MFAERPAFRLNGIKVLQASVACPLKDSSQRETCGDGGGFQAQLLSLFLIIVQQVSLKGQRSLGPDIYPSPLYCQSARDSEQCERSRAQNRKNRRNNVVESSQMTNVPLHCSSC